MSQMPNRGMPAGTLITRRDYLRAAGAGVLAMSGGPAPAAETRPGSTLRDKARRNLKPAVFTSVYGHLSLEEAARRIREDGFAGVCLDYRFADVRFDPLEPDWHALRKIMGALERNGLRVAGLWGYYNVIDPDADRRRRGERRMGTLIEHWKRFGTPVISTETGTFNRENEFAEHPDNFTEAGYVAARAAFERLARAAEKTGAIVAIEPYWRNVICSVDRAERLFREVNSPSLRLTMDPCNYFRNEDLPRMRAMLEDIFRRVGDRTVLAHAKDVKATPTGQDLPAAGLGQLDYATYLRLLAGLDRELFLVIEHLQLPDVPRARDFVKAQIERL